MSAGLTTTTHASATRSTACTKEHRGKKDVKRTQLGVFASEFGIVQQALSEFTAAHDQFPFSFLFLALLYPVSRR